MNKLLLIILIPYNLICLLVFSFQENMVFHPDQRSFKDCPWVFERGGEIIEDKKFGARYYLRKVPGAKGTLVHFHGNAGNACDRYYILDRLKGKPFNIVLAEYPGYGGSDDPIGEKELLDGADKIFTSLKQKDLSTSYYIFGESLGTAVSTYIASRNPVKGLILQSPFPSLGEVGQHHYPFLPIGWLVTHKFPLKLWAKKVDAKVLIIHGEEDRIIPFRFGKEAASYFPREPRFRKISGKGHNNIQDSDFFWEEVFKFLK